jgi:hypothetical protein
MSTTLRHARVVAALACLALPTLACNSDDVTAPPQPAAGEFTVDASQGWVYVSLVDSAVVTPTPTPSESAAWDIAFFATNVMLNGGEAGPGNVTGFCVCQNTSASDDQVLAMTPESELADYEGVTAVPGTATFLAEVLTPAVAGWFTGTAPAIAYTADTFAGVFGPHKWYRYNILGDNRISPVFEVYLVRRGNTVWKLQVLNYYSATNAARHISFRYERISD